MRRVPLTFRALVLLPLLAVLTDQTRAAVMCGPRAESCLEAAGQGWYAAAGLLAFALYGAGAAARRRPAAGSAPGFRRLWAVGTGAVWASCAAQAGGASPGAALIGGGWLGASARRDSQAPCRAALGPRPADPGRRPSAPRRSPFRSPACRSTLSRGQRRPAAPPRGRAPPALA